MQQAEELSKDIVDHHFFIEPVRYVKMKIFAYPVFYIKDEHGRRLVITAVLGNKQDMLNIIKKRL